MPNFRPTELLILVFILIVVALVVLVTVLLASRFGRSTGPQVPPPPGSSADQAQYCHQCGSPLKPGARFCSDCGTPQ